MASLSVQPSVLWSISLPASVPLFQPMSVTGSGVAITSGSSIVVVDGDGTISATISPPHGNTESLSPPLAGPDGGLFFSNLGSTYRADRSGSQLWSSPTAGGSATELVTLPPLLSDGEGHIYAPGLGYGVSILAPSDGSSLGSWTTDGVQRWIELGVAGVLFMDRTGLATVGPSVPALGIVSAKSGQWLGELTDGAGWYPPPRYRWI